MKVSNSFLTAVFFLQGSLYLAAGAKGHHLRHKNHQQPEAFVPTAESSDNWKQTAPKALVARRPNRHTRKLLELPGRNLQTEPMSSLTLGEVVNLPDLEAGFEVVFSLGLASPDRMTGYTCRAEATTGGEVDIDMYLGSSLQCQEDEFCTVYANPGDEYTVAVYQRTTTDETATGIMLICDLVEVGLISNDPLVPRRPFNLTRDESLMYGVQVEKDSSLLCEIRRLPDGQPSRGYKLTMGSIYQEGPADCDDLSSVCSLYTGNYSGYVYAFVEGPRFGTEEARLVCATAQPQELLLDSTTPNMTVPLTSNVLTSYEYIVQDDVSRLFCTSNEASVHLTYQYPVDQYDTTANEKAELDMLAQRNRTIVVSALAQDDNEELECRLVTFDIVPLELDVPSIVTFGLQETKAFQFTTGDLYPSEVYCKMTLLNETSTNTIFFQMANVGRDGTRTELSGSHDATFGDARAARDQGWGPNHLGTWFVLAKHHPNGVYIHNPEWELTGTDDEVEVVCGTNVYDKLESGVVLDFDVAPNYAHTGFHFEVSEPSEVTCTFTSSEPIEGYFALLSAEDFQVRGDLLNPDFYEDTDGWCYDSFFAANTESQCTYSTDGPSDAVIIVQNEAGTAANDLTIVCTSIPLKDDTAVQRTNDLFN